MLAVMPVADSNGPDTEKTPAVVRRVAVPCGRLVPVVVELFGLLITTLPAPLDAEAAAASVAAVDRSPATAAKEA